MQLGCSVVCSFTECVLPLSGFECIAYQIEINRLAEIYHLYKYECW